jgi:hypothetical protein
MELGGTARGSQYDAILASGTLGLDGALQVALINGFAPSAGNSFDILDWGTLNGTFDTLQLPALTGGLTWNTSQLYTSGVLSIAAAGLAGDYNNNGRVDAADYVVWRENDGSQQGYNIWRTNFGRAVDAASGAASGPPRLGGPTFAVPEPASYILALTGMLTVRHRRSRRRPLQFSGLLAAKY